jgi:hypothetical protein
LKGSFPQRRVKNALLLSLVSTTFSTQFIHLNLCFESLIARKRVAMFSLVMSALGKQFAVTEKQQDKVPQLQLTEYVNWLEIRLLAVSDFELLEFNELVDLLFTSITTLKCIGSMSRVSHSGLPSGQANKVLKMLDHIEALSEPYETSLSGKLYVNNNKPDLVSHLPDFESIKEMVSKNKAALKIIDEIASSKKAETVKFKGSKPMASSNRSETKRLGELMSIKNEARNAQFLLDKLVVEVGKKLSILNYFGQIKLLVHIPVRNLLSKRETLPSLKEYTDQIEAELDAVRQVEQVYNETRAAAVLANAATASYEAGFIENVIGQSAECLRYLNREEVFAIISAHNQIKDESERAAITNSHENPEVVQVKEDWIAGLAKFVVLSVPDLMTTCIDE